jgi:phage terminase large subunit-like protein
MSTAHREASGEFQEFVVKRDGNRPISFAGQVMARASSGGGLAGWAISAVLYKTRGGKYVSTLSKSNGYLAVASELQDPETARGGEFHKAQVFDTFDDAVAWFRPGRLTDALRKQLRLDEPERIE